MNGALADAMDSWNAAARMGVLDRPLQIGQLAAPPPPVEPESIGWLLTAA